MTIYVDDWRQRARVGPITATWSHLTTGPRDDLSELHAFAARIGLRRAWFQDKPWPRAHYDITESKRRRAIAAGAVPICWREAAALRYQILTPGTTDREWACRSCGDGWFGTPPEDELCPGGCLPPRSDHPHDFDIYPVSIPALPDTRRSTTR